MKLNRKDIMKKLIFNYKVCTEYATQDKTFEELEKELLNLNLKLVLCKDKNEVWNLVDDAFEIENKLYIERTKQNE